MLVACPKCESRYKLPDDKIRPTGTKVRCPRCQFTFYLFPDGIRGEPAKKPEQPPFKSAPPKPEPKPRPAPPVKEPVREKEVVEEKPAPFSFEGAKTVISDSTTGHRPKEPSPFKRPAEDPAKAKAPVLDDATEFIDRPRDLRSEDEIIDAGPVDEAPDESREGLHDEIQDETAPPRNDETGQSKRSPSAPLRPFGDATFAEIQQAGGRIKQAKRWVGITAAVGVVLMILAIGINNLRNHSENKTVEVAPKVAPAEAPVTTVALKKPMGWYEDDPSFFQDYLSQMATLPVSEQQKPEIRALLAEALISNGMMIGTDDQVISGMGFASGLIAGYPNTPYGFYGLASYAIFKEEVTTLGDLLKRWPAPQSGPEYEVAQAIVEGRTGNFKSAMEQLKALLAQYPQYFRAEAWALLFSLDHWKEAETVFGLPRLGELVKKYEKRRALVRSGVNPPVLFASLDKRLAKKSSLIAELQRRKSDEGSAKAAKPPRIEAPVAEKPVEPPVKIEKAPDHPKEPAPLAEAPKPAAAPQNAADFSQPKPKLVEKPDHEVPAKETKKASVEKTKKALPKADPGLIALNKQSSKAKQNAKHLFEQGNQKQTESKIDEAIALYQSALREDPDLADVYKQLGVIYMNRQERERALRAFKIYLQLKPESDDRQVVQGWISSMQ